MDWNKTTFLLLIIFIFGFKHYNTCKTFYKEKMLMQSFYLSTPFSATQNLISYLMLYSCGERGFYCPKLSWTHPICQISSVFKEFMNEILKKENYFKDFKHCSNWIEIVQEILILSCNVNLSDIGDCVLTGYRSSSYKKK